MDQNPTLEEIIKELKGLDARIFDPKESHVDEVKARRDDLFVQANRMKGDKSLLEIWLEERRQKMTKDDARVKSLEFYDPGMKK